MASGFLFSFAPLLETGSYDVALAILELCQLTSTLGVRGQCQSMQLQSCYSALDGLGFEAILLPWPLVRWNYRHVPQVFGVSFLLVF